MTVTLEVASKDIALGDLMKAGEGSVIELDKLNGEPLDVKVNGSVTLKWIRRGPAKATIS